MSITYDSFERYRQKGLDARRAGQWDSARIYLLEAARAMVELSKQAQGDELRKARKQTAAKLLELRGIVIGRRQRIEGSHPIRLEMRRANLRERGRLLLPRISGW